jgi:hypothetical protein
MKPFNANLNINMINEYKHEIIASCHYESPSLVLVINDTKLLMPCVKYFELGINNTCDEGVCGKEWWPQDHKEMHII